MKKTCFYTAVCVLLIVGGIVWVKQILLERKEVSSLILSDQAAAFALLLPKDIVEIPIEVPAEPAVSFASDILPVADVLPSLEIPSELLGLFAEPKKELSVLEPAITQPAVFSQPSVVPKEAAAEATEELAPVSAAPSYLYFYTGVPVQPVPMFTVSYTGRFTTVTATPSVIQSSVVPVFVPQIVPSRAGAPKWVYSNGVVIKPKAYFPNQPVRNSLRAVTP